jgi:hypothetical protein
MATSINATRASIFLEIDLDGHKNYRLIVKKNLQYICKTVKQFLDSLLIARLPAQSQYPHCFPQPNKVSKASLPVT